MIYNKICWFTLGCNYHRSYFNILKQWSNYNFDSQLSQQNSCVFCGISNYKIREKTKLSCTKQSIKWLTILILIILKFFLSGLRLEVMLYKIKNNLLKKFRIRSMTSAKKYILIRFSSNLIYLLYVVSTKIYRFQSIVFIGYFKYFDFN